MPEIRVPATGLKSTRDWSMKVDDSVSSMTVLCRDLMFAILPADEDAKRLR
jgi:hypothetical protein